MRPEDATGVWSSVPSSTMEIRNTHYQVKGPISLVLRRKSLSLQALRNIPRREGVPQLDYTHVFTPLHLRSLDLSCLG